MRKITGLIMAIIMMFIGFQIPVQAIEIPIRVVIDNEEVFFPDAKPFIDKNNRTQTPARFIGEALGATVSWDQTKQQAKFVKDSQELIINIGSKVYQLNGVNREMDTVAIIVDNRTFVPARYVAEAFGAEVGWVQEIKTVTIKSGQATTVTTGNGEVSIYSGIEFNPVTDIDIYGGMDFYKTGEFVLKLAKSIRFYKENGVLYFKGSYPEIPEGFRYDLLVNVFFTNGPSFGYFSYSIYPDALIPGTGEFVKKARDQNIAEIDYIQIVVELKDKYGYSAGRLLIHSNDNSQSYPEEAKYIHMSGGKSEIYSEYIDFEEMFQWK